MRLPCAKGERFLPADRVTTGWSKLGRFGYALACFIFRFLRRPLLRIDRALVLRIEPRTRVSPHAGFDLPSRWSACRFRPPGDRNPFGFGFRRGVLPHTPQEQGYGLRPLDSLLLGLRLRVTRPASRVRCAVILTRSVLGLRPVLRVRLPVTPLTRFSLQQPNTGRFVDRP